MLLSDPTYWDFPAVTVGDGGTEDGLAHEDAFGMMPQGTMPEVGEELFRLIEPLVDGQIVIHTTAPFFHARKCVMKRMCHRLYVSLVIL